MGETLVVPNAGSTGMVVEEGVADTEVAAATEEIINTTNTAVMVTEKEDEVEAIAETEVMAEGGPAVEEAMNDVAGQVATTVIFKAIHTTMAGNAGRPCY